MHGQTLSFATNTHAAKLRKPVPAFSDPASLPPGVLARHATQALIAEAELTPKPGLVDRRSKGAHRDLSLDLFLLSAHVLEPYFRSIAEEAQSVREPHCLREALGKLGRDAEAAMLMATGGVNTHRGGIWSLGLLIAGAATQGWNDAEAICLEAARLARIPDRFQQATPQPKAQPWRVDAAFGARDQALRGFPHVRLAGLPALHAAREAGAPEELARVDALLTIMATLPDTCILQRGGPSALGTVQQEAAAVLRSGGCSTFSGAAALHILEETMLRLWVSPGGAADLLAATLFLDGLTSCQWGVCD